MMKRLALVSVFALIALAINVQAQDKDKANPNGTWKWTITIGDTPREQTVKLKADGEKLSGVYLGRQSETPIEDGKFKDGEVSFKVTRERNGVKTTSKFMGKVSGDTIKGKSESEREGKSESRDWEAKREKEKA